MIQSMADPAPAHCIFENFDSITHINFIVINTQCLQYVFYSLLLLQKHRICVKGHQTTDLKNYTGPWPRPLFLNSWIRYWQFRWIAIAWLFIFLDLHYNMMCRWPSICSDFDEMLIPAILPSSFSKIVNPERQYFPRTWIFEEVNMRYA